MKNKKDVELKTEEGLDICILYDHWPVNENITRTLFGFVLYACFICFILFCFICLSRPYPFKFFKGCLPQILLGPFLSQMAF